MNTMRIFGAFCFLLGCSLILASLSAGVDHSVYLAESYTLCLNCHPQAQPTHLLSSVNTNTMGWPVGPDNRMLCLTCHDCVRGSCILRRASPEICMVCHDCTKGMGCVLGVAHMGDSDRFSGHSRDCLSCHDGTVAVDRSLGRGNHPVERIYLTGTKFNPLTGSAILLVDGKITCISCHNPYRSEDERLNRSNQGSALCVTCHRK